MRANHFKPESSTKNKMPLILALSAAAAILIAGGVLIAVLTANRTPVKIAATLDEATVAATAAVTEQSAEASTAAPTEASTAAPTEASTAPTQASTAAPTESEPTEAQTEKPVPPTTAPTVKPTQPPTTATIAPAPVDVPDFGGDARNTIVGNDAEGYYYVGSDGQVDFGCCMALTVNGVDWNVIEGRATPVSDSWDACLHSALDIISQCTDSRMSREQKLRAAFEYIKRDDVFLEGVLHDPPYREMDWPVVCANDLFVRGMGDCFSYGAAFAFIGKGIGCENCYACNSGGHGWAEIDGKVYDPEWDMHHQEYNHFGVSPGDSCDVKYFTALVDGVDWMHVRV